MKTRTQSQQIQKLIFARKPLKTSTILSTGERRYSILLYKICYADESIYLSIANNAFHATPWGWDAYLLLLSVILTINHTTKEEEDDLYVYATENFRPNFYAWLAEASLLENLWYHKHNAGRKVANLKLTKSISSMSWSKSMTMEVRDSILFSWN